MTARVMVMLCLFEIHQVIWKWHQSRELSLRIMTDDHGNEMCVATHDEERWGRIWQTTVGQGPYIVLCCVVVVVKLWWGLGRWWWGYVNTPFPEVLTHPPRAVWVVCYIILLLKCMSPRLFFFPYSKQFTKLLRCCGHLTDWVTDWSEHGLESWILSQHTNRYYVICRELSWATPRVLSTPGARMSHWL